MKISRWLVAASITGLAGVALAGCAKHVEVDAAQLGAQINTRAGDALNSPVVAKALEELFAAVGADPAVAKAGASLMSGLGEDPRLQPGFGKILESLGGQPVMQLMVKKMMHDHPTATPDQIGALMEKRVSGVLDGKVYDQAFNKAFDRFLKRPEINALFNTFAEKVVRNPETTELISATLGNDTVEKKWRDKLLQLNGGSLPDKQRATDLLAQQMLSLERVSEWYARIYTLPALKRETAIGVAKLLDSAAFHRITGDLVAGLVGDAAFQQRAVDGMVTLLGEAPTGEALERAIGRLLDVPIVSTQLAAWMKALMADPELATIGDGMLKAIVAAPEMRAAVASLVDVATK